MHISVIGTGYVGLVTGACFAEFGVNVTCMDTDARRIARLEKGEVPFFEPGITELVAKGIKEDRLHFTTDVAKAVDKALVIFIAVGTPPKSDGSADLSYVEEVGRGIAKNMTGYKVIVTKSTVPVGTGEKLREVIKANQTGRFRFDIVSNPEFLREGSAIEDFMRPNRVVIGADSEQAVAIMKDLYRPLYLLETPIVVTDIPTAEMIKYASNAFLAVKISFINEIATVCEKVGADVQQVAKGIGLDRRIGSKFLHAGPGYGGSCFPKDTIALVRTAQQYGSPVRLIETTIDVNETRKQGLAERVRQAAGDLNGKTVGILGLTFKPNTDDMRDSPSLAIVPGLQALGATVQAYDPQGMREAAHMFTDLALKDGPYEVADGADVLVIVTEWNEFRALDLDRVKSLMKKPVIVDLRNVYKPGEVRSDGFEYTSIGRA